MPASGTAGRGTAAPGPGSTAAGQATVELALALPLVVMLMLLVAQVGLVVRDQVLVTHAAREAVRTASVQAGSDIDAVTRSAEAAGPLDRRRLDVEVMPGGDPPSTVRVRVRYRCRTDLALIGALVPDLTLEASAVMRSE